MSLRQMLWMLCLVHGSLACGEVSPDTYQLRYATPYPPQHPFSRADQTWIEHVVRASHGRLHIEAHWSGSLLSADQSLIELLHGVADVGAIQPIYARGGAQALRAQAAFYAGAASFEQQVAVYKCLAQRYPVFDRELAGLRVLAVQGGGLPGVLTRARPVTRLAELSGLRLRAPSELIAVLRELGADPVSMPMNDVYAATAKGVIDGVIAPPDALRSLHLAEVGHYYAELAIPRGAYPARAIRARTLQQLPAALQRVIESSGGVWEAALASEIERGLAAGRAYASERGVLLTTLADSDQRAFERAYNAVALGHARELATSGANGEAMFRDAQAWIARLRANGPLAGAALCPRG